MAFKIAASMGFKEAARKASPVLLEPIMSVEVVVPEEFMGVIIGDLNSRRGRIEGIEHRAGSQVIKSLVPLAEMLGYATDMRSITQGQAQYSMHFARYEQAPPSAESGGDEAGVTANKPKGPEQGMAPPLPNWTQNSSDRKFSGVILLYIESTAFIAIAEGLLAKHCHVAHHPVLSSERNRLVYIRACQEHFFPSAGGTGFVRDIQPLLP
jgi:hypothetical protein